MSEFNVTCYVDEDLISSKAVNAIIRSIRESIKEDLDSMVRDEVNKCFKKINVERIAREEFDKCVKYEISDLVYRIRRDEYDKFYWNGKECNPSPERLYKLLTSYVGYIDLLNDKLFVASVRDKVTNEIMAKLGKNHTYASIAKTIEKSMHKDSEKE